MRKDGNDTARKLYLSRPERNKGISLEWDEDLKVWIKGGAEYFEDRFNCWEPFDEAKIFARNSKATNSRSPKGANG